MQIAAEHPKAVSECPWIGVEERLFLDGIALHTADISPRYIERSAFVEAYLADSRLAVSDGATVTTRITADTIAVQLFVEIAFADLLIENFAQRGQSTPLILILVQLSR